MAVLNHGVALAAGGAMIPEPAPGLDDDPEGFGDLFRSLVEAAPDALVIAAEDGVIVLVNRQAEALFGYQRAELVGQPIELLIPARLRDAHRGRRAGYSADPRLRPMCAGTDLFGVRRDGSEVPVEVSLSPLRTSRGLLVAAAIRDTTERRAAQRRIGTLARIVESSPDAIITTGMDGAITSWNAGAARMFGYQPEEAIGLPVSILAPPERPAEVADLITHGTSGEPAGQVETQQLTRSGVRVDVEVSCFPLWSGGDQVIGAGAIIRDITERKVAEEATRQYQEQRRIALTLQHSLMGPPADVPGLRVASRYRPATEGAGVGGDWFDLIALGAGRIGLMIGDVMGRGLEAATIMGRLRSAANALARTGLPPDQLMEALDRVVSDLPDQMATCCYLVADPASGKLTGCSAGHLPVIAIEPGGAASLLPIPLGVPLGVGGFPYHQAAVTVPARSTLALFSDGLVESSGTDLSARLEALRSGLAAILASQVPLEIAADELLDAMLPRQDQAPDDVTLLLVQLPAEPLAIVTASLPPAPEAVPEGRKLITDTLRGWGHPGLVDDASLLASELLSNAIRYSRQRIGLRLHHTPREVIAEISDDDPRPPRRVDATLADERGRGLLLVEALAGSWGCRQSAAGKTVWFALPKA